MAVLNVVGYVSVRAYECLALFVLTAYSAHCYCKNESLAVLAALFVANFVFGCGRVKEGMEDMMKGPAEHMADAQEAATNAATACNEHSTQAACKDIADAAGTVTQACKWDESDADASKHACVNN